MKKKQLHHYNSSTQLWSFELYRSKMAKKHIQSSQKELKNVKIKSSTKSKDILRSRYIPYLGIVSMAIIHVGLFMRWTLNIKSSTSSIQHNETGFFRPLVTSDYPPPPPLWSSIITLMRALVKALRSGLLNFTEFLQM